MLLRRAATILLSLLIGIVAFGCDSTSTIDNPPPASTNPTPFPGFTFPTLDLANGVIPLPNDLLRDPATGRNNFPGTGEPVASMNTLSGFSTAGNLLIPFTGTVIPSSVTNDTLPVFNAATGQRVNMVYQVSDGTSGSTVVATPVLPLAPSTQYIVVITEGVTSALSNSPVLSDNGTRLLKRTTALVDGNGNSVVTGLDNATAAALEPVRQAYQPIWAGAEQLTGTGRESLPLAFAFTTQAINTVLPTLRSQVVAANAPMVNPNGMFPIAAGQGVNPGPPAQIDAFFASINLSQAPNDNIGSIWQATISVANYISNPVNGPIADPPVNSGNRNIPILACFPNAANFPGPRPVVIFQHGITRTKGDIFAMADAYCGQGFIVIATDLVLHGDLQVDVINNTTMAPGPDGMRDPSGTNFLNLQNLRMTRDNIRQSVVHLFAITNAIMTGQTDLNGDNQPDMAPITPLYLGTSLGGIVGTSFVANEPNVQRAVLNVPGGRLTGLLLNSPTFSPTIISGLAAAGVQQGTPAFAQFVLIAQTVVDDVDPINQGAAALTGAFNGGTPAQILVQEVIGDTVVPNSATTDMVHAMGTSGAFSQVGAINAKPLLTQVSAPFMGSGLWQIANAGHGALLDPAQGPTAQIAAQIITFLGTGNIANTGFPRTDDGPAVAPANPDDYDHLFRF